MTSINNQENLPLPKTIAYVLSFLDTLDRLLDEESSCLGLLEPLRLIEVNHKKIEHLEKFSLINDAFEKITNFLEKNSLDPAAAALKNELYTRINNTAQKNKAHELMIKNLQRNLNELFENLGYTNPNLTYTRKKITY